MAANARSLPQRAENGAAHVHSAQMALFFEAFMAGPVPEGRKVEKFYQICEKNIIFVVFWIFTKN